MSTYLIPSPEARRTIETAAHADASVCWTCSTCDSECPIFRATGRLRPQKIVKMANLGLLDELVSLPEIWYCLTCRRCNQVCPNWVKPAPLIHFIRQEAIRKRVVSWETFSEYRRIFPRFQRVRWHAAEACLHGEMPGASPDLWRRWAETPIPPLTNEIFLGGGALSTRFADAVGASHTLACFNCSECSSVCPIFFDRSVFDPQWIFRMINMGQEHQILASPSIWLCIGCERCTEACSQSVKGHSAIKRLQELALKEGIVDPAFPLRWKESHEMIYSLFLEEVDALLGYGSA
jgi:heterodisulfide reductase subunit C